ncbi:MAG: extracellular solute-binding protein [Opitutales bacterium]|nr:extracellular solute-binding protein [Opitutales bacterium]
MSFTRQLFGLSALAASWLLAACGPVDDSGRESLVVYSAGPRPLIEHITRTFTEETGIAVDLFVATTGQVMARLEAEKYRQRADVVIFASEVAAKALKANARLLPYPDAPWLEETENAWHDPDSTYFATGAALVGIALRNEFRNPDLEWADFFEGRFQGRVTMPSPSRSGSAGDFVVAYALTRGEDMWGDFRQARRGGLEFAAANSQAITSLLIGAFDAIVGAVDYLIYRQMADGAQIHMHFPPSGSALVTRPIAILAGAPHPERARAFLDHYFSPEMQQALADAHLLPARRDIPLSHVRAGDGLPPTFETDIAEAYRRQTQILRRFQIEIERAAVVRP